MQPCVYAQYLYALDLVPLVLPFSAAAASVYSWSFCWDGDAAACKPKSGLIYRMCINVDFTVGCPAPGKKPASLSGCIFATG